MLEYITTSIGEAIDSLPQTTMKGRVTQVLGTVIEAICPNAKMGDMCILRDPYQKKEIWAEVVGFAKGRTLLTPLDNTHGISINTQVISTGRAHEIKLGPHLLGAVLNGMGEIIEYHGEQPPALVDSLTINATPPDPLSRQPIEKILSLGVKAVDALTTCGEGQRLGIFAAAGVGKSTLLSMFTKYAEADVIVLGLIGERGREVREFIDDQLGKSAMEKSVVVVATADKPAMIRARAAYVATTVAEYFRDHGKRVLLLMDSVTRFARALREIGLASGEAPTRRGYPPSVFSAIPQLMERAGQSDRGSITGLYTVLVEGDDMNEPIADEMRSIMDGHLILSRKIAAENQYPAIDILQSLSRVMNNIASPIHLKMAGRVRELLSKYQEIEMLVRMGEYTQGSDPLADEALEKIDQIKDLLRQDFHTPYTIQDTLKDMSLVVES